MSYIPSPTALVFTKTSQPIILSLEPDRPNFYVHPDVYLTTDDELKGTGTVSKADVQKGTLLFIDKPYSIIPTAAPGSTTPYSHPLCSRLQCSQEVDLSSASTKSCHCITEVVWCNAECQALGKAEHDFECSWLKTHSKSIRQEIIEPDFFSLWLIVRTLAQRDMELSSPPTSTTGPNGTFPCDWNVIRGLRSNEDELQPLKVQGWRSLAERYLVGEHSMLRHSLNVDEMLTLMCQVEINHYDLWTQLIGVYPLPAEPVERAESCFAYTMYLRTPFLNHSCDPSLMHQPDGNGRMVFHATRFIPAGEEFSIAYFDLAEPKYADVKERRAYLEDEFCFTCVCPRCLHESGEN
ncbi:hypothetical protein BP5796_07658 [Coleophoma crateriformis]|uniref:SET domain-containing protein n=1 Tax=Coleophoma crateriformis TaxID=565419 RepID=A0A3D8RJT3_9HELO|nr:hypothetical protein BP5796_07658 [Coleophoma crateriformis]